MAVDLSDLIPYLRVEVNPPGVDLMPNTTDAELVVNLSSAAWEAILDGVITGYTELDGIVQPTTSGGDDLSRQLQQLIVFYAGLRIVRNQLRDIKALFRAKAGDVEYETQQSASILSALFKELSDKRKFLLYTLSDLGVVDSVYIDGVYERDQSLYYGYTSWSDY